MLVRFVGGFLASTSRGSSCDLCNPDICWKISIRGKICLCTYTQGCVRQSTCLGSEYGLFVFSTQISGSGIPSPYQVQPLEARVPIGVFYEPPIRITNYLEDKELHVKEIFTTGFSVHKMCCLVYGWLMADGIGTLLFLYFAEGFLQLALPPGVQVEANGRVSTDGAVLSTEAALKWIVPNRSTHEVIHLSFRSHTPGQYQGYVHVKTDMDNMVIPVDITVLPNGLNAMPQVV